EPLINVPVQHRIAENDQEADGHETQRQSAEIQLRFDARSLAIASAFDVQLDSGPEQDEAQRDGQDEHERGNSPKDESLIEVFGVFVEREGYLPDNKCGQDEEQYDSRSVEKTLAHLSKVPCCRLYREAGYQLGRRMIAHARWTWRLLVE